MYKPLSKSPKNVYLREFRAKKTSTPKKKKKFLKENAGYMNAYSKKRKKQDKIYKKTLNAYLTVGNAMQNFIRGNQPNDRRNTKFYNCVGCTNKEFLQYIERRFKKGMTFNNYGRKGWKLERIIPIKHFNLKNKKEFSKAFNYKNCKPCWSSIEIAQEYI